MITKILISVGNIGLNVVASDEFWNLLLIGPSAFFDKVKFYGLKWLSSKAIPLIVSYPTVR